MTSGPGYAKHPNHRISIEPSKTVCEVRVHGELLVSSKDCLIMQEGSYPAVIYFPLAALPQDRLLPSSTQSYCPFKGTASYWHLSADETSTAPQVDDILWGYPTPYDEMQGIAGYVAFYDSKVDNITGGHPS